MKDQEKQILELITRLSYGVEDCIKMGDDGWKEATFNLLGEIRNEILKYRQSQEKVPNEISKYNPKEGTPQERMYTYFCRAFHSLDIEKIYLPDMEVQAIIECEVYEIKYPDMFYQIKDVFSLYPYAGIKAMEEAFKKVLPERRSKNKQTSLL